MEIKINDETVWEVDVEKEGVTSVVLTSEQGHSGELRVNPNSRVEVKVLNNRSEVGKKAKTKKTKKSKSTSSTRTPKLASAKKD